MNVAVFSGMLGVTFFGLLLTPVFYLLVRRMGRRRTLRVQSEPVLHTAQSH